CTSNSIKFWSELGSFQSKWLNYASESTSNSASNFPRVRHYDFFDL
ncbi:8485_t:CDS:1, partial [Rhizophagus irregularis]